jgi:tetratricopeptide (TPR) repeat protein
MRLRLLTEQPPPHTHHIDIVHSLHELAMTMCRMDMLVSSRNCLEAAMRMLATLRNNSSHETSDDVESCAFMNVMVLKNAGLVYSKLGESEKAIEVLKRAVAACCQSEDSFDDNDDLLIECYEILAHVFEHMNSLGEEAERYKRKAAELKAKRI